LRNGITATVYPAQLSGILSCSTGPCLGKLASVAPSVPLRSHDTFDDSVGPGMAWPYAVRDK
jgi:hypothetical protein